MWTLLLLIVASPISCLNLTVSSSPSCSSAWPELVALEGKGQEATVSLRFSVAAAPVVATVFSWEERCSSSSVLNQHTSSLKITPCSSTLRSFSSSASPDPLLSACSSSSAPFLPPVPEIQFLPLYTVTPPRVVDVAGTTLRRAPRRSLARTNVALPLAVARTTGAGAASKPALRIGVVVVGEERPATRFGYNRFNRSRLPHPSYSLAVSSPLKHRDENALYRRNLRANIIAGPALNGVLASGGHRALHCRDTDDASIAPSACGTRGHMICLYTHVHWKPLATLTIDEASIFGAGHRQATSPLASSSSSASVPHYIDIQFSPLSCLKSSSIASASLSDSLLCASSVKCANFSSPSSFPSSSVVGSRKFLTAVTAASFLKTLFRRVFFQTLPPTLADSLLCFLTLPSSTFEINKTALGLFSLQQKATRLVSNLTSSSYTDSTGVRVPLCMQRLQQTKQSTIPLRQRNAPAILSVAAAKNAGRGTWLRKTLTAVTAGTQISTTTEATAPQVKQQKRWRAMSGGAILQTTPAKTLLCTRLAAVEDTNAMTVIQEDGSAMQRRTEQQQREQVKDEQKKKKKQKKDDEEEEEEEDEKQIARRKRLKAWQVVLHNDDVHAIPHVTEMLVAAIPLLTKAKAHTITVHAHKTGMAVALKTWKEKALQIYQKLTEAGLTISLVPSSSKDKKEETTGEEGQGEEEGGEKLDTNSDDAIDAEAAS